MPIDLWEVIAVVCGALIALGTVLGWIYRKVVRPMWRATIRSFRRFNRGADDLLGRPAELDDEGNVVVPELIPLRAEVMLARREIAQLRQETAAIRADLDIHVQWHPSPGGKPASGALPKRRRNGNPDAR